MILQDRWQWCRWQIAWGLISRVKLHDTVPIHHHHQKRQGTKATHGTIAADEAARLRVCRPPYSFHLLQLVVCEWHRFLTKMLLCETKEQQPPDEMAEENSQNIVAETLQQAESRIVLPIIDTSTRPSSVNNTGTLQHDTQHQDLQVNLWKFCSTFFVYCYSSAAYYFL